MTITHFAVLHILGLKMYSVSTERGVSFLVNGAWSDGALTSEDIVVYLAVFTILEATL